MPEVSSILVVQSADVLESQRDLVETLLGERLGATVAFATSAGDVVLGTHYDVVIAPTLAWLPEVLARVEGLKWIHFLSAGVERIWDMNYDWSGLTMTKSSGVHAIPMSEYAIGAMLHFAKSFDRFVAQSREQRWERSWLGELAGREAIVIGMGSVGTAVAERARAFGMTVRGVARTGRDEGSFGVVHAITDLPTLLPAADYVVVTVPLTPDTRGLVNADFFASVKAGTVLVDMSRGGVVSEDALLDALDEGVLRGAALDVFEAEPLPLESRLWNRSDVLLTPHVAGTTPHYMARALEVFVANAERLTEGAALVTPIDLGRGY